MVRIQLSISHGIISFFLIRIYAHSNTGSCKVELNLEGFFSSPCGRWFPMVFCKRGKEDKVLQKTLTVACNTDTLSSPCTLRLKNHLEDAEADTVFSLLEHFLSLN